MGDFGIKVARIGSDVDTATGVDVLMNTRYPFAKLDTAEDISFQNITFTFNNDPPNPSGVFPDQLRTTTVYTQAHPYNYIPAVWGLVKITTNAPSSAFQQAYFLNEGVVAARTAFSEAGFRVEADDDNIYFEVDKWYGGGGDPVTNIAGLVLKVRLYVFADEVTT